MLKHLQKAIFELKDQKPLVLNLTNHVTMDFMANSLLALGAAPIMTCFDEELEELVKMASVVNINIGTLDRPFIERALLANQFAQKYQKPVVLDPVGAGATSIRTKTALKLLEKVSIVRGNASEILSLSGMNQRTKGVESIHATYEAKEAALDLARLHGCTVVVSGKVDFITDGIREVEVPYGSDLMSLVTGMGCTVTAVIAAFNGVLKDSFEAGYLGALYFALCGELAASSTDCPGTFRTQFIDALYKSDFKTMNRIYEKKD